MRFLLSDAIHLLVPLACVLSAFTEGAAQAGTGDKADLFKIDATPSPGNDTLVGPGEKYDLKDGKPPGPRIFAAIRPARLASRIYQKGACIHMDPFWKNILWSQFGAAIDMLENAIRACPDELWSDRSQHVQFGCAVAHTLFWLDFYLSGITDDFSPPQPFTMEGLNRAGTLSEPVYSKGEMLGYLEHGRTKCRETIQALTDERVRETWGFDDWPEKMPFGELLLYTMRHVQEHGAQLALMLGQTHNLPPDWHDWVGRAKS